MQTNDDRRFEVRRERWRLKGERLGIVVSVLPGLIIWWLVPGSPLSPVIVAFVLVWALRETYDSLRPVARVDDFGITYAASWATRRVAFADVIEWEAEAANRTLAFTLHDGSRRSVNLRQVTPVDRERLVARLTPRLPRGTISEGLDVAPLLAEAGWFAVLVLASLQVIGASWPGADVGTKPVTTASTSAVETRAAERRDALPPNGQEYGSFTARYAAPPQPETLPLPIEPSYAGPWENVGCLLTPTLMVAITGGCGGVHSAG